MKRNIFSFLFALVAFASCNQQKALDYNNNLVAKETKLSEKITVAQNNLNSYIEEKKYDSIAAVAERVTKEIDNTISDVIKIPAPNIPEAGNFKNGYIHFYQFIKSIYAGYKDYGTVPDVDKQNALNKVAETKGKMPQVLSEFQAIQRKFAQANYMKIQTVK